MFNRFVQRFIALSVIFMICHVKCELNIDYYVAAVVEYDPYSDLEDGTIEDLVQKNADEYIKFIGESKQQNADIIVFPEVGLVSYGKGTTYASTIPSPTVKNSPCVDNAFNMTKELVSISCAAAVNKMYVVVNVPEVLVCDDKNWDNDCPSTGTFFFNCDVVFDRSGTVITRYRKFNLFYEVGFTAPSTPGYSVFETDFGVTFGVITCFDIIFEEPTLTLVRKMGAKDIIFPTAWFSELPFLTAVQEQSQWSYGADVNLLASGYSKPSVGSTGSGIYNGRNGPIVTLMAETDTRKLLVANVPKKFSTPQSKYEGSEFSIDPKFSICTSNKEEFCVAKAVPRENEFLVSTEDLSIFETVLVGEGEKQKVQKVCHNEFCCDFEVDYFSGKSGDRGYRYRYAVYKGTRFYTGPVHGDVQICAIISCAGSSLSSCGKAIKLNGTDDVVFSKIKITGNFERSSGQLMPNSLLSDFNVLDPGSFNFTAEDTTNSITVEMSTNKVISDLLTFGIYGSVY